ncbi:SnoaL-like domain-containing protein [Janthinobacterium sp. TND4EL3]|uniref:nuclear transport factor 2 family protein n=1 Tax=Janthinobacterium sp. TND4EL3 TaxID=1907311 RepID=UPI0009545366|nr:nuclear transport factor 2 family protein [Janthinobacterium sp. TND4EL3]SIQ58289.1 SnoaL-like domain-containing protein [Janthinobacterium sp. TND4EL3]
MHKLASAVLFGSSLFSAGMALAQSAPVAPPAPAHVGRHAATPEDLRAIEQVVADFQAALIAKDVRLLSSLMLHTNILFASPADDAYVKKMRDTTDVHFDGVGAGGYVAFANFIKHEPQRTEEKFYNVKITQDRHVAWVNFDYEFLVGDKLSNYGVEAWQMVKRDGNWKILSVVWSMHAAAEAAK